MGDNAQNGYKVGKDVGKMWCTNCIEEIEWDNVSMSSICVRIHIYYNIEITYTGTT